MISLEKWYILTPLQKLPKNVGDFGQLIVVKGFEKLPTVQKIAQSGHTDQDSQWNVSSNSGADKFPFENKLRLFWAFWFVEKFWVDIQITSNKHRLHIAC